MSDEPDLTVAQAKALADSVMNRPHGRTVLPGSGMVSEEDEAEYVAQVEVNAKALADFIMRGQ